MIVFSFLVFDKLQIIVVLIKIKINKKVKRKKAQNKEYGNWILETATVFLKKIVQELEFNAKKKLDFFLGRLKASLYIFFVICFGTVLVTLAFSELIQDRMVAFPWVGKLSMGLLLLIIGLVAGKKIE